MGPSGDSMIAYGGYRASADRRVMYVSNQIVQQCRDWSQPVRFKFVENEDGSVEIWMQNAEVRDA